ncbi:hypothetical protein L3X38_016787 [Prunus dulcis]|uniref:F-box domain-containing protein n=1 Tax=Prunus dulcis TaxID=3755 RepID=A0AAD4W8H3_PRUDU|nr:hypothetical protein L3X38_016787 [Prunus dulcis]
MPCLPAELLIDIVPRLSPKDLPLLTRDLIFGYCNGLVCIQNGEGFLLWNPSIQKFKIEFLLEFTDYDLFSGFGLLIDGAHVGRENTERKLGEEEDEN